MYAFRLGRQQIDNAFEGFSYRPYSINITARNEMNIVGEVHWHEVVLFADPVVTVKFWVHLFQVFQASEPDFLYSFAANFFRLSA